MRAHAEQELQHQELLHKIAESKRGPKETWQVRLLRTLPPDRTLDTVFGKGMTWAEELKRRRAERKVNLICFLEDKQRPLMLEDAPPGDALKYVCAAWGHQVILGKI